jgi:Na+/H+ antiporter NhaC
VLAALLVGVAWLLPQVPGARMAALEVDTVLAEPVEPALHQGPEVTPPLEVPGWALDDEGEPPNELTLAQAVLFGPAVRVVDDSTLELVLHGTGLRAPADPGTDLLDLHLVVRRSVVRGLRQAASEAGRSLRVVGEDAPGRDTKGGATFTAVYDSAGLTLFYEVDGAPETLQSRTLAGWRPSSRLSVLPALCAIALAVLFRRPLPALLFGVLAGAYLILLREGTGAVAAAPLAVRGYVLDLFWPLIVEEFRYEIILFVVFMMAMVGVITRNGGVQGVMQAIAGLASSARRSQLAAYLMGLAVFFDDYANTILVGSTMRPLTDRWRVSREKLSYLIDSTAAPVAGLAVLSTWIAFEVSTFSAQLPAAGLAPSDGYSVFLQTLPYRFYCVLTLVFVAAVCFSGRDFGPMLAAERRARRDGTLVRPGGQPLVAERAVSMDPQPGARPSAFAGIAPIATFVLVTLGTIVAVGLGSLAEGTAALSIEGLTGILYGGSGSKPLMYGAFAGFALALAISVAMRCDVPDVLRAALKVIFGMGIAILILYHAWMIGAVCDALGTASYLTGLIGDRIDPRLLPTVLFLLSGFVAFATGSSWSTMSILLPIVVGLAYGLGQDAGLADTAAASGMLLMLMSIGAVLEGAIFGDHCSPISDTTVMSSIAAAADHVDHVRTQIPYALCTMLVAMVCGYLPCAFLGASPWIGLVVGAAAVVGLLFLLGRRADEPAYRAVAAEPER